MSRRFSAHDLVGGHAALDLVNTVTARNTPAPVDWLDFYPRLLEWALLANIVAAPTFDQLTVLAGQSPHEAAAALARAKEFREALHAVCSALIRRVRAPDDALSLINRVWQEAQGRTQIVQIGDQIEARLDPAGDSLDLVRDRVASGAVELLLHWSQERARICRGGQCGWLFIDSSKGGRRVWCDMATCGNAAKSRKYLEVHRHRPART